MSDNFKFIIKGSKYDFVERAILNNKTKVENKDCKNTFSSRREEVNSMLNNQNKSKSERPPLNDKIKNATDRHSETFNIDYKNRMNEIEKIINKSSNKERG